jgi:Na+-transporting methylmalonyl-CoA/oxaloacetate decarboxylase gamma subunit
VLVVLLVVGVLIVMLVLFVLGLCRVASSAEAESDRQWRTEMAESETAAPAPDWVPRVAAAAPPRRRRIHAPVRERVVR